MIKRMGEDWASALVLADELAKGPGADLGKVGSLVDQLTALDEKRKQEIGEPTVNGPIRISRFYNIELDRALVNLRRFLREGKTQPALIEAQMADRPRTAFNFGQELLDMDMSESIFYALPTLVISARSGFPNQWANDQDGKRRVRFATSQAVSGSTDYSID
jgi:hypothetical protein